jgi:hypothetical protein
MCGRHEWHDGRTWAPICAGWLCAKGTRGGLRRRVVHAISWCLPRLGNDGPDPTLAGVPTSGSNGCRLAILTHTLRQSPLSLWNLHSHSRVLLALWRALVAQHHPRDACFTGSDHGCLGGEGEAVVDLALELDREGETAARASGAAHDASEVGVTPANVVEDVHRAPGGRFDCVCARRAYDMPRSWCGDDGHTSLGEQPARIRDSLPLSSAHRSACARRAGMVLLRAASAGRSCRTVTDDALGRGRVSYCGCKQHRVGSRPAGAAPLCTTGWLGDARCVRSCCLLHAGCWMGCDLALVRIYVRTSTTGPVRVHACPCQSSTWASF